MNTKYVWMIILLLSVHIAALRAQNPLVGDTLRGGVIASYHPATGNVLILHPGQDPDAWTGVNTWAATLTTSGLAWRQPTLNELQSFCDNRTAINTGLATFDDAVSITDTWDWTGSIDNDQAICLAIGDAKVVDPKYFTLSQRAVSSFNIVTQLLAEETGGVVAAQDAVVNNSIVWGNTDKDDAVAGVSGNGTVRYTAVGTTAPAGTGNTTVTATDFVDAVNGNYHLEETSALIGAGDAGLIPVDFSKDLDGYARTYNAAIEMGAYAFVPVNIVVSLPEGGTTHTYSGSATEFTVAVTINGSQASPETVVGYAYQQKQSNGSYTDLSAAPVSVGQYKVTVTVEGKSVSFLYSITAKAITVTAIDETIEYGNSPVLAYEVSPALYPGDWMSGSLSVDNLEPGTHVIEQNDLTAGDNYTITYESATLTVQQYTTGMEWLMPRSGDQLLAYPNPTKGELTISLNGEIVTDTIQLYNFSGRLVFVTKANPFNIAHLPKGFYIAVVKGKTVKVIKIN